MEYYAKLKTDNAILDLLKYHILVDYSYKEIADYNGDNILLPELDVSGMKLSLEII